MAQERTELTRKMNDGEFVISVQIDPSVELNTRPFLDKIKDLRKIGVSVLDINSRTIPALDTISLGAILHQEGFEIIPHITSRPSSVNGLIEQVRSGYALFEIKNYLVITGDYYRSNPASGVFETDSLGLIKSLRNHFVDHEVIDIAFGASVNQNNPQQSLEGQRVESKQIAGADFFMSQPVFNGDQVNRLITFYKKYSHKPLLVGVWPLIYQTMIEKIKNGNMGGIVLPENVYYESILHNGHLRSWGLNHAGYLIENLRQNLNIDGVYIVSPNRNPLHLTDLLTRVLT